MTPVDEMRLCISTNCCQQLFDNAVWICIIRCMSELRKALKRTGFTQAEFAREIGVSPQVIHNWVKRGVPPQWAVRVAQDLLSDPHKLCPDFPWPK